MTPAHGLLFWHLDRLGFDYISRLKRQNCKMVYLKTMDDASAGIFWPEQCNPATIKKFNDNGQQVIGWGYVFDKRTSTNVAGIVDAVKKSIATGCKGFVVDIESEVENVATHAQVLELMTAIRAVVPAGQLGYTSFGNPESHPHIPWKILNDACDYCMNQFYYHLWKFDTNENEVKIAFAQHKKFGLNKPIYPIFTAEANADPVELQKFIDAHEGSAVYAAQCPPAWEIDYRGDAEIPAPQPTPNPIPTLPDNKLEIIKYILNSNDPTDCRAINADGKEVAWITASDFETLYLTTVKLGSPRAKFTIQSLVKKDTKTLIKNSEKYIEYFKNNFLLVDKEVSRWFAGRFSVDDTKNACVAHVSSCLSLCKLSFPTLGSLDSINVDYFVNWSLKNGWIKIINMSNLLPGDICVSGPSQTNIDHVYSFVEYIDKHNVNILDNQKTGIHPRSLVGEGCGRWQFAIRMP